jgi:transposase InsO family protein
VFQCLTEFHAYVQTQFQLPLLAFQTDNGREFDNHAFRCHLSRHGVALRLSCPYTSSQNGKAERIIRTLNDCIRSLLLHASMPETFWAEALSTATYLLNRRPCKTTGTVTPF